MISLLSRVQQDTITNSLSRTSKEAAAALKELSTGLRASGADSVTLGRIQQIEAQITGIDAANNNIATASSMLETAEGGMNEIASQLQTLRSYAVAASDASLSASERAGLSLAASTVMSSIDSAASGTVFNNTSLLDGSFGTQTVQIGPNSGDQITASIAGVRTSDLGLGDISFSSASSAQTAIDSIDAAISTLSTQRSAVGSALTSLESAHQTNTTTSINLSSAVSNLGDTDLAALASRVELLALKQKAQTLLLKAETEQKRMVVSTLV